MMSKPSDKLHKHDQHLLSEAMDGIKPITQDKIISSSNKNRVFVKQPDLADSTDIFSELSDEYDPFETDQQRYDLNYHHESISKRKFRELKTSKFSHDLILDLHGASHQQARNELVEFLHHCQQHDFRHVVIMPGQGHGILRKALNVWLRQLPKVLAFAESPQRYGGKGVIRLLLAATDNVTDHTTDQC